MQSATTTMPKRHGRLVSLLWICATLRFGAERLPGCVAFHPAGLIATLMFKRKTIVSSLAAISKHKPNKVAAGGFVGSSKARHKSSDVQKRRIPSLTQEAIELLKKHGDNVDAASSDYFGRRMNDDSATTLEGQEIDPFEVRMAAVRSDLSMLPECKSLW
jgi:hypothetical protein